MEERRGDVSRRDAPLADGGRGARDSGGVVRVIAHRTREQTGHGRVSDARAREAVVMLVVQESSLLLVRLWQQLSIDGQIVCVVVLW